MFSNTRNPILTWLGLSLFCVGACASPSPAQPATPKPISIGVINSLSGRFDSFGPAVQKGLELAVEEINAQGGINGRKIQLLVEDDASNREQAVKAFEKLASESKVAVVIGPLSSSASVATLPLANKYQVVQIAPLAGHPDLTRANDYAFRMYTTEEISTRFLAEFAGRLKAKRVAFMNQDTEFGNTNSRLLKENLTNTGIKVVADERIPVNQRDFRPQLTRIRDLKADLLIYPSFFFEGGGTTLTKQAEELLTGGPNIMIAGTACLVFLQDPRVSPERLYFSNETFGRDHRDHPVMQDFITKYEKHFFTPATPHPAVGHATMSVVKTAMEKGGFTGPGIKSALQTVDMETAFGRVKFDSNGGNVGASYSLYQLKDKQLVLVK